MGSVLFFSDVGVDRQYQHLILMAMFEIGTDLIYIQKQRWLCQFRRVKLSFWKVKSSGSHALVKT